jgi:YegS/Rv2252/BmrU family lipid kinase
LKIAVIINGISHKKKKFYHSVLPALQQHFSVELFETQYSQHAIELAAHATLKGYEIILAVGGDGTISQVINGILKTSVERLPILGIIPLGSGNDFATMIGATMKGNTIAALIQQRKTRPVDVARIECVDEIGNRVIKYSNNVCSTGMGPATVQRLERLPRWLGATFRYYVSVIDTFLTHPIAHFEVKTENQFWKGKARVVAIANGISFGNKIYVAPDARPDDGVFATFIATNMPLLKFLIVLLRVKQRKKIQDESIRYGTATEVHISSPERIYIEAEGEIAGLLPAHITMLKGKLQILG